MPSAPVRLGTRRSPMATSQSQRVADSVTERTQVPVELVLITSFGDVTRAHLTQLGGTGVFVNALRDELQAGTIDVAVHSLKDLPTTPADGLTLVAITERDDPRDALCAREGRKFADLPPGAAVGTGSPRRVAQLAALRPDLNYVPIRGNAGTRLAKVASGEVDAVVLAYAGLHRVGRADDITDVFEPEQMLPAPGQGALAVECRTERAVLDDLGLLAAVDHEQTRAGVTAERVVLAELEAGCAAPVGAYAECGDGRLRLRAAVVATDGSRAVRRERTIRLEEGAPVVEVAADLGRKLAREMIEEGADRIVAEAGPQAGVPRPE